MSFRIPFAMMTSLVRANVEIVALTRSLHGWSTARDEVVVHWGSPIGSHGADIVSGDVTLWDAKYRGERVTIHESSTFKAGSNPRKNAIKKASKVLKSNKTLP